jgi:hypothetical protein
MFCNVRSRLKFIISIMCLLRAGVCVAQGQRLPPPAARPIAIPSRTQPDRKSPSITFLSAPNGPPIHNLGLDRGVLDLGSIACCARIDINGAEIQSQKDSFILSTKFGLRIGLLKGRQRCTATVSAFLISPNPQSTVWVDGVRLSTAPGIIGRQVSCGVITEHLLKIAVPISMPAGQLLDSIGVVVTPN